MVRWKNRVEGQLHGGYEFTVLILRNYLDKHFDAIVKFYFSLNKNAAAFGQG